MFGKHRTRLTHEGWYYLVVAAFVLVGGSMALINLMLLMAGMMIGAIYFNWRLARSMFRGLEVHRRLPDSISAGDALVVELEATSRHYGAAVRIEDSIRALEPQPSGGQAQGQTLFPRLIPGQPARAKYQVRFGQRGRYEFGPLQALSRYPFGLVRRTVRLPETDQVIVLPRLGKLTNRWSNVHRDVDPGARRVAQRHGLTEGDFYGLRDWRPGDSRRWIHWRTSARRGGLMVRQFEQPRSQNLTVLVELWQPPEPDDRARENVELAVSFAATIATEVCRRGGSSMLLAVAGREVTSAGGGASQGLAREVVQNLAVAQAGPEDRLDELFQRGLDEGPQGGRLVWISTRPGSPQESERLARISGEGARRAATGRMLRVDASSDQLFEYFQLG